MTIPFLPLPTIRVTLAAIIKASLHREAWFNAEPRVHLYQRGIAAFTAGIEALKSRSKAEEVRLWVPDYVCEELLEFLPKHSIQICFYPVCEDLQPDWSWLEVETLSKPFNGLEVFILVHYFGFPNAIKETVAFCRERDFVLFEDGAHVIKVHSGIGEGDMAFLSPWKLFGIPSGGLLLDFQEGELPVARRGGFSKMFTVSTCRWLLIRIAQRCCKILHIPWHIFLQSEIARSVGEYGGPGLAVLSDPIDRVSEHLYCDGFSDLDQIIRKRRAHYDRLMLFVTKLSSWKPLYPRLPEGTCPYAFPLMVGSGCEPVVSEMNRLGILASRWPDLPKEILECPKEHQAAISLQHNLFLIPIHQGLKDKEVDLIGSTLISLEKTLS